MTTLLMYGVENRSIHRGWPGCNFKFLVRVQKYRLQIYKHHHDEMPNTVKLL